MATENPAPHAIIFPYMAQGHALPLLDLAKVLSQTGLKVTFITTPSNSTQISSKINSTKFKNISIHIIPFPNTNDLPLGCENTKDFTSEHQFLPFLRATLKLKDPFECFLKEIVEKQGHPLCVVCDFFLGWAITLCSSYNIPGILFHGMGVLATILGYLGHVNGERIRSLSDDEELYALPGFTSPFLLTRDDFPLTFNVNHPVTRFMIETGDDGAASNCWGILSNSFEELEGEFVGALESAYGRDVKGWCIGPLHLYDHKKCVDVSKGSDIWYERWLDDQEEKQEGVVYASFGTQSHISNKQMDEIALGLEIAGQRFIWVLRATTSWTPPEGWEERVKGQGLVVREWVDQRRILAHPAICGFISHCGWNSVLESLCNGVPMLAWPLGAEQSFNAKLVVHVLKAGIGINSKLVAPKEGEVFGHDEIGKGLKELVDGESGIQARERAREIGEMAKKVVEEGGSSSKKLDQLISSLTELRNKRMYQVR